MSDGASSIVERALLDHEWWAALEMCACGWQEGGCSGSTPREHLAHAIVKALELQEERSNYSAYETKAESGGSGVMAWAGQTSRYVGIRTQRRFVSSWQLVGARKTPGDCRESAGGTTEETL